MPRGRKGPPRASIDSILLAICRRDDIEPTMMEYYFERLDEEWADGAREKVLSLLRSKDLTAHAASVQILSELATDADLEELEDVVTDPTVSDMAKLTLAPVLKDLHSEMADDGIIEYLNDPEAAMLQMQMRLLELVGQSELGVEAVLEDVMAMPIERRLGFVDWLGRSHDSRAAHLLVPLLENQTTKVVTAVIDALEQLGASAAHQTIPALNYLLANSSNRVLKQQARAALGRLTMLSAPGTEAEAMAEAAQPALPLFDARVSFVDGTGSQIIMLSWKRDDDTLKGVNILYQDQWGIKDCYGTDEMDLERWFELVDEMREQGFSCLVVPVEYCLALIAEATALNRRGRHRLPIAYSVWRPLLDAETAQRKEQAHLAIALEPRPLVSSEPTSLAAGEELFNLPEFASWMYEPLSAIQPYINRYWAIYNRDRIDEIGPEGAVRPRTRGRSRKGKQKEQQAALEALIDEALEELIDDKWRLLYEQRLRRQGKLFEYSERQELVASVDAVAATLRPDSGLAPRELPFVRAMLALSIKQGPFRMLLEALDSNDFGPLPVDIFPPPH